MSAQDSAARRRPAARDIAGWIVAAPLLAMIRLYQWFLAPLMGSACRFAPSCSHYGFEAIAVHGPVRGSWLTLRRLLRCHPWGGSGFDPVPPPAGRAPTF